MQAAGNYSGGFGTVKLTTMLLDNTQQTKSFRAQATHIRLMDFCAPSIVRTTAQNLLGFIWLPIDGPQEPASIPRVADALIHVPLDDCSRTATGVTAGGALFITKTGSRSSKEVSSSTVLACCQVL